MSIFLVLFNLDFLHLKLGHIGCLVTVYTFKEVNGVWFIFFEGGSLFFTSSEMDCLINFMSELVFYSHFVELMLQICME